MNILVTGANRGIGKEFVRRYLQRGDTVVAITRKPETLVEFAGLYPKTLRLHRADVTDGKALEGVRKELGEAFAFDLVLNNAGIYSRETEDLEVMDFAALRQAFEVNAIAPLNVARIFLPCLLRAKGAPKLANITSLMGSIGDNSGGGAYGYRMSKAALNMFTKSFAVDYPNVVALTLHPDWVRTDMGGAGAPTTVEESVAGLMRVIDGATSAQSGRFFDYSGEEMPW